MKQAKVMIPAEIGFNEELSDEEIKERLAEAHHLSVMAYDEAFPGTVTVGEEIELLNIEEM